MNQFGNFVENLVKCPVCFKEDKKSQVFPGSISRTAMYCQPFYDEDGRFHQHDSNLTTSEMSCSNGHKWTDKTNSSCWCGGGN